VLLRHLASVVVLPGVVTIVVPLWITRAYDVRFYAATDVGEIALMLAGAVCVGIGLILFTASLRRFATEGQGTLAPWDPPHRLVLHGPYRYVRNPMISGVVFVLAGEALVMRSWPHAAWAAAVVCINLIYIPLLEEPQLEQRFGDDYREFRRHVPRIIPRLRPWRGGGDNRRV
jgi:protein-S-isoprenylcysteine O-methyltransferase Ste14